MTFLIGLDIGGTKIAGALFDDKGKELDQIVSPTPKTYSEFVTTCHGIIDKLESKDGQKASVGMGIAGAIDREGRTIFVPNIKDLGGKFFHDDIEKLLGRHVVIANDANCAALSEASDGAGQGFRSVFGLIIGTGVGGGFVVDQKIVTGANGAMGEIGHLPLPYYESSDGERVPCGCGQTGCIEKLVCGAALARLYKSMTGKEADAAKIAELARAKDGDALRTLDRYYTVVAKAMVTVIHSLDPEIIVVSGGLNALPGLYDEVPKRWGQYAFCKNPKTKLMQAKHGSMSGLRGAAWLGKGN